jgi:FixJ family two-component response regulator
MKASGSLVSVVDDDLSVRESLPDLLREFSFSVQSFSSAEAFLASGWVGRTECLLLDVAMPGMTGPELKPNWCASGSPPRLSSSATPTNRAGP